MSKPAPFDKKKTNNIENYLIIAAEGMPFQITFFRSGIKVSELEAVMFN